MAPVNVSVTKLPAGEKAAPMRYPAFELPLLRGSLFNLSPFTLMRQFTEDMDKFFTATPAVVNSAVWSPAVEIKQKDGKLLVTAELPGLTKEDIKVSVEGDALIVEGERKQEKEEKREGFYHSERSYGKFYRSITLPEGAKVEATDAQFNNGVLEITVPVAEAKTTRQEVPVKEGAKKAA